MFLEYKPNSEYFFPIFADNLFCGLSPKSLAALSRIKQTKLFPKGSYFFSRGDLPCCIYLLREGRAKLFLNNKSKNIHIARTIEPDEIFGLTEAISKLPYETSVGTVTACVCESIDRDNFIRFLQAEPEVCFRLARTLGANLHKSYELFFSSIN